MKRDDIHPKDERAMGAALDHLDRATGSPTPAALPADLPAAEVERYVESLALLAYSVEPAAPSPRTKASILERVRAEPKRVPPAAGSAPVDPTLRHSSVAEPSPTPGGISPADLRHEDDPADMTLFGLGGDSVRPPVPANDVTGLRRAVRGLAAGLIVCLVALGYLYGQLDAGRAAPAEQAELARALERARERTALMEERLEMVTTVARVAYPMHRASTSVGPDADRRGATRTDASSYAGIELGRPVPGSGEPDGIIYVCGQHQRWYLSLDNLEPAPPGQDYHLWFLTSDGEVDAGPLEVAEDGSVDLHDLEMPPETHGFLVSLEDAEDPPAPRGEIVLRADQAVKL